VRRIPMPMSRRSVTQAVRRMPCFRIAVKKRKAEEECR
jgi:hypothetical protein